MLIVIFWTEKEEVLDYCLKFIILKIIEQGQGDRTLEFMLRELDDNDEGFKGGDSLNNSTSKSYFDDKYENRSIKSESKKKMNQFFSFPFKVKQ